MYDEERNKVENIIGDFEIEIEIIIRNKYIKKLKSFKNSWRKVKVPVLITFEKLTFEVMQVLS